MKYLTRFLLPLILLGLSAQLQAEVTIEGAWVRLMPPNVKTTAAYMSIYSEEKDALISASSPLASMVEIHESSMNDGVMSMNEVERVELPKQQKVYFRPQGLHLMVMGLKASLKESQKLPLTLTFENAGEIEIEAVFEKR